MPPPGLCLVLLGVVSGTPQPLSVDLEAKLETLVGTNLSSTVPANTVSGLINFTPGIALAVGSQTADLKLSYTPLLYFSFPTSPGYPSRLLVLNRLSYEAGDQVSRTAKLTLTGTFWYGDQNYSPVVNQGVPPGAGTGQPPGTPLPPGQLPQVQLLKIITSSTQLGLSLANSTTVESLVAVGFLYSEGADAASRLELPLQRGPFVLARTDVQLGERDTLTPALRVGLLVYGPIFWGPGSIGENGSTVVVPHFQEGLDLFGSELTLKWAHQESRALSTELAAGVALFNQSATSDVPVGAGDLVWLGPGISVPASTFLDPIVSAALLYRFFPEAEQPFEFRVSAAVAPLVNQFAGTVWERVEGTLSVDWGPSAVWRFGVSGGAAYTFNPQETYARGEIRAVWSPAKSVAIAAGARIAWVDYSIPGVLNGLNWSVFLSVTGATGAVF